MPTSFLTWTITVSLLQSLTWFLVSGFTFEVTIWVIIWSCFSSFSCFFFVIRMKPKSPRKVSRMPLDLAPDYPADLLNCLQYHVLLPLPLDVLLEHLLCLQCLFLCLDWANLSFRIQFKQFIQLIPFNYNLIRQH